MLRLHRKQWCCAQLLLILTVPWLIIRKWLEPILFFVSFRLLCLFIFIITRIRYVSWRFVSFRFVSTSLVSNHLCILFYSFTHFRLLILSCELFFLFSSSSAVSSLHFIPALHFLSIHFSLVCLSFCALVRSALHVWMTWSCILCAFFSVAFLGFRVSNALALA